MIELLENNNLILIEAAIIDQLHRSKKVLLHPTLFNAPLIYDKNGRDELEKLYRSYVGIALSKDIPCILCTPTWRANFERVKKTKINLDINSDAVKFMCKLKESFGVKSNKLKIGGMIGCKNDSYQPQEGLITSESEKFHSWQINQLAEAGVDFLIAVTLPNIEEALGIAHAMEKTGLPYIISFVINRNAHLLDGTNLIDAIKKIDEFSKITPLGYMINCAYPTFLCIEKQPIELLQRLIGYQANASSLNQNELDGSPSVKLNNINDWGQAMIKLNRTYGIKILGGCCGTGSEHLRYIVDNIDNKYIK